MFEALEALQLASVRGGDALADAKARCRAENNPEFICAALCHHPQARAQFSTPSPDTSSLDRK